MAGLIYNSFHEDLARGANFTRPPRHPPRPNRKPKATPQSPMAVTISLYNHTARRFADGSNVAGDTYRLMLCTAATFNAADATLAAISKTEVANANGYTTNGPALTGVAITTVTTNDARFDADDVTLAATGGSIAAEFGILYNDTDADDPPVAFIDFDGAKTAGAGTDFKIVWNANGIVTFTVA